MGIPTARQGNGSAGRGGIVNRDPQDPEPAARSAIFIAARGPSGTRGVMKDAG